MTDRVKDNRVRNGLLAAALAGLLFTFDLPLLRLAGLDQWTLVFGRGLFLFMAIAGGWVLLPPRNSDRSSFIAGWAGIGAVVTNTLAPICYIASVKNTSAANVVFIMALIPLLSALLSLAFIRERIHTYTWAAAAAALVGVAIIVGGSVSTTGLFGDLMAFAAASCTALSIVIARSSDKQLITSFATGSLVSAVLALMVFGAEPMHMLTTAGLSMPAWFWLGLNGLVFIPLAFILIAESPRHIPSADVSMFFLLETVLTPGWIWLLTGETPSARSVAGGAIIVLTLLLHSAWRLRSTLNAPACQTDQAG